MKTKSITHYCGIVVLLFAMRVSNAQDQTNAGLSLKLHAGLSVTGRVGQVYQIQYATQLQGTNTWFSLTHFTLQWNPHDWVDTTQPATGQRFYRAVQVNVPTNVVTTTNMVFIPPGKFMMGSPPSEPARWNDEGPQRLVTLSRGFWMGRFEVTQGEYLEVMGNNPSFFSGVQDWPTAGTDYGSDLTRPVEQVPWNDAVAYCAALTARERTAGRLPDSYAYRLPTEAEWEYACRAGTTTPHHYGNALRSGMANFDGHYEYPPCGLSTNACDNPSGTYLQRTTSVGSYAPNPWGLYDMHGNVSEFCQDRMGFYPVGPVTDPTGPASGLERVVRGGILESRADFCRSAFRDWANPTFLHRSFGFRVALALVP